MPVSDAIAAKAPARRAPLFRAARGLAKVAATPLGLLGLVLVSIMVGIALFAPWLAPYDPNAVDVYNRLAPPSTAHWLGTDHLGRDVLSRVLIGTRIAMLVALAATGLSLFLGLILGLVAGYGPRWLDNLFILLFDSINSLPTIMVALALITLVGPSLFTIVGIITLFTIPSYARITRNQTLVLKEREFILAERSLGASAPRILFIHLLPNVVGPLLIIASMDIPVVITLEAGFSFLGLGIRPPTASWGNILNDGYSFIRETVWLAIAGGLPLVLATLGFTFLGERLRDVFDPRIRESVW